MVENGTGVGWALGVPAFSVLLPATTVAINELDPVFVSIGRA